MPEDEAEIFEFIEKDDRVAALLLEYEATVQAEELCPPRQLIERTNCERMFLVLKCHFDEVKFVQYEKGGKTLFGIDAVNSPVVSFKRSLFREKNKLGQGSVSAYPKKLIANNQELVEKSDEFNKWAKGIVSHIRKKTPNWHEYKNYRISERGSKAQEQGMELIF
ncbi:MAG: hypothetical protein N838_07140 [Thiohalocapsa sp. PB-PSB1]|jgi:hypothetical protein|nr:MAG: hypothetical protein N838_07140 [Thiohalocapsa sp. PB-PSB1]HCS91249.1 hypothetical protein [Chromatiaceae bacterium]